MPGTSAGPIGTPRGWPVRASRRPVSSPAAACSRASPRSPQPPAEPRPRRWAVGARQPPHSRGVAARRRRPRAPGRAPAEPAPRSARPSRRRSRRSPRRTRPSAARPAPPARRPSSAARDPRPSGPRPTAHSPRTHDGQWSFYRGPASRLHRQCIARVACRTMWPPVEHPIGTPWRLELLGPPRLTGPDGPVDVAAPKANLLLWLVAGHWPAAVSRGWLTNALYPDVPEREARRNLTNLLSRLGHWLPPRPLRAELDRLRWDEAAGVALDLAE